MDSVLAILFFAAILALVIYQQGSRQKWPNQAWRQAADELDLGFSAGGVFGIPTVAGLIDGLEVRGERSAEGVTRLSVSGARIDPALELSLESRMTNAARTGDPDLDEAGIDLRGERVSVLALLTPEVRATLRDCVNVGVRVSGGCVEFSGDGSGLAERIRRLVRVAHALEAPEGAAADRLAHLAESDPLLTFRVRCWEALGRAGDPRGRQGLLRLAEVPVPEIQAAARRALDALEGPGAVGGLALAEQPAEAGAVSLPPTAPKTPAD